MQIPIATYRLQFQPEFGFADAADIVAYLSELGISHIYASPIFRARKGSLHGYDCVDFNAFNAELGSPEDWQTLVDRLRTHTMGWLQDIVPNHMAFHADNRMLADVLENGTSSGFHDYFDICWNHPSKDLQGRVMAPFLGQRYGECLEKGEIRIVYDRDGFAATYGDLKFPLQIETYLNILDQPTAWIKTELGEEDPAYNRWIDALDDLESLVLHVDSGVRQDHSRAIKQTLWDLFCGNTVIRRLLSETLRRFNGEPGNIHSYKRLDGLLSQQRFRLCYWQVANEEINYRRFFDINELIALRQENREVFEYTHRLLGKLASEKSVSGVRIDHVDGLADPEEYLQRLRRCLGEDAYILVEKILAPEEPLPLGWPVQGTTGYDFAHWLNALFVYRENETRFTEIYTGFSGRTEPFEDVVYSAKKWVLASRMAGDLDNLARRIKKISALKCFADNLTLNRLKSALSEVLARFHIYRTYLGKENGRPEDRAVVEAAISRAVLEYPHLHIETEFLRNLLLENVPFEEAVDDVEIFKQCGWAVRAFQQLSAALMAKGFEDTAFYRYNRLVSLNEVGSAPDRFGCSVEQFHAAITRRAEDWPHAMNSTATHDSKRGEDVRARLNVLSEIPTEWKTRLEAWHTFTRGHRMRKGSKTVPDKNTEYLLYQTLIGAWPQDRPVTHRFVDRVKAYMIKAAREAGEHTSWLEPEEEYETALAGFVESILDPSPQNEFMPAFVPFCKKIAFFGLFNLLSQCLLKIAAPGVPDFYQGTELPQLALVDPDNRRPVAYDERRRLLKAIGRVSSDPLAQVAGLLENRDDGRVKLFVIARALATRRQLKDVFHSGRYLPLEASGPFRRHIVAFAREAGGQWCVAVVPRFLTALVGEDQDPLGKNVWRDTAVMLPPEAPRSWRNIFTSQSIQGAMGIAVGDALQHFPVALLLGEQTS
ncbi:MAG: malto-oligosyltrehalose synthase [Desulfobacterales bacterium]